MSRDLQQRISALRSIERRVQPDEAWIRATRETLLMQVRNTLPTEAVRPATQVRDWFRHFVPKQVIYFFRGPLMATLSILTIALGGSVASVSAAEQSLPGDFLYSLKLATEQARLALTPSKDEKLKLKIEFTSRRGEELKSVAQDDTPSRPERVVQAAEILKRDLDTVKQQLDDVNAESEPGKVVEAAKLVDQTSNAIVQSLQMSKLDLPAETKEKVTEAQAAAADAGVKAIEVMVTKNQESSANISEGDVAQALQTHTQTIADATVEGSLTVSSTSPVLTITSVVSSTMPFSEAIEQIKTATQQAFAAQKTAETLAGTSSSTTATLPDGSASSSSTTNTSSSSSTTSGTSTSVTPP